jgi:hypothetical protein
MTPRATTLLLGLPLLLAACASAGMTLPGELASAERMPVEGRGGWRASQRAAFGPYEATDVDRSWTRGSGWRVGAGPIGGGTNRAAQEYVFRFLEGGEERGWVRCATWGSRGTLSTVVDVDLSARVGLECAQYAPGDEEPVWDLVLGATRDRHLEGHLRLGEHRYAVVSTGPGGGLTPADPFGFEIRDGERALAAVEIVNEGAVWLAPEVVGERRTAFAAVAAGLLLYDPLNTED